MKIKQNKQTIKMRIGWAPVAYAHNPSYSGGRDQEDHGSKTSPGK
jgi:hypothetical protein